MKLANLSQLTNRFHHLLVYRKTSCNQFKQKLKNRKNNTKKRFTKSNTLFIKVISFKIEWQSLCSHIEINFSDLSILISQFYSRVFLRAASTASYC